MGINLTSADTVILHDPDWNPAIDDQVGRQERHIERSRSFPWHASD